MASFHFARGKALASTRRRLQQSRLNSRLHLEQLEDRRVLAPVLSGISFNDGTLLSSGDVKTVAPTEVTFKFNPGERIDPNSLHGIVVERTGFDGEFGDGDDVVIQPGFLGIGNEPNEVIFRFAEPLPDDLYQITIGGSILVNQSGEVFNAGEDFVTQFELDLGATIEAVVPQPITRDASGNLVQARDQIEVYFNDDDLSVSSAQDTRFYQLIFTGHQDQFDVGFNTASNADDGTAINPISVSYDAAEDRATLTFADDLSALTNGPGTYRLRIGTSEGMPQAPTEVTLDDEPGATISSATSLGALSGSQIVSGTIGGLDIAPEFLVQFPGSNQDPGSQPEPLGSHVEFGSDPDPNITTIAYNFQDSFAIDEVGNTSLNRITERQKLRAREAFELYEHYLGVQFIETESAGFTIATGDVRFVDSDPEATGGADRNLGLAIMNGSNNWSEVYGADYFQETMRQIGRLLGMGEVRDLSPGTIQGFDPFLEFERPAESVFPGDADILHGQFLYRPDGNDIDFYQFTLASSGVLSIETIAERLTDSSSLDTVLRLYRQTGDQVELVSQNNDYFSNDSFINQELGSGTYYLGVSSTGNEQYNPFTGNGGGGTSQGAYDLRLNFRPVSDNSIVDTTGKRFDGDSDGLQGGTYNFWFRATTPENTHIVDKLASPGGDGSLASPFNTITAAMNAAGEGDVVRAVGNNQADGDLTNDVPYEIGFSALDNSLEDGGTDGLLRIKKGVTLMIDEGAVFKLSSGAILVGSSSSSADGSGAAIQVLGTPDNHVIFTSLDDESRGVDNDSQTTTPMRGDWGGIQMRDDLDRESGRFLYDAQGIFLNTINQSEFYYGGGIVPINSLAQVVNSISIVDARPTISNNTIQSAADAGMSATPNSFTETTFNEPIFQSPRFTSDYTRVGPDIHGNLLTDNSVNALFVSVPPAASASPSAIVTTTRWNDVDITHVVSDQLSVAGNPGGPIEVDGTRMARTSGGLIIDPGVVVKSDGGRIEAGIGANVIAEGTATRPIIFTSLLDDQHGAGGTFDSSGDGNTSTPSPGDWGGVYLAATSTGSFANNFFGYGGGSAPIEGELAGFNVLEIHQAQVRVVDSVFEHNGEGLDIQIGGDRVGRGLNEDGVILVTGAQPVIYGNQFTGNDAAAININVNSLNYLSVTDWGRSRGETMIIDQFADNQGALIRANVLTDNDLNGMVVRGGTVTTEAVMDDSDITHIVRDGIYVPNFHTYGGLRLQSGASESLVVKFLGRTAGITTTGSAFGIADHIGGSVQVIGQPGYPVVLTSLFDDSVGSGKDNAGRTQSDTDGLGRPLRSGTVEDGLTINLNFGANILGPEQREAMEAARRAADIWEERIQDPITINIDVDLANFQIDDNDIDSNLFLDPLTFNRFLRLFETRPAFVSQDYNTVVAAMAQDAGAHEAILAGLPNFDELNFRFPSNAIPFNLTNTMNLTRANAKALDLLPDDGSLEADGQILINSNLDLWDFDRTNGLQTYREDFETHMLREIGDILGFSSSLDTVDFFLDNPPEDDTQAQIDIALEPLDLFRFAPGTAQQDFTTAERLVDPTFQDHVFYAGGQLNFRDWPFEGIVEGEIPLSRGRQAIGVEETNDFYRANRWRDDVFTRNGKQFQLDTIGIMDPATYLRDGEIQLNDPFQTTQGLITNISEADLLAFDSIGYDMIGPGPGDWDGLLIQQLSHDANVPHITEREDADGGTGIGNGIISTAEFLGELAPNRFTGDNTVRLGFEVHGVVNQPSDVDLYSFSAIAGTETWIDLDNTSYALDSVVELVSITGEVLARSENSLAEINDPSLLVGAAQPFSGVDFYSTNGEDAGFRVVLPGPAGVRDTFYVRVRSASDDLSNVNGGETSGRYDLQIRLRERDEVPGTSINYADIRFAETGIKVVGPPVQSPLLGEQAEDESVNDYFTEENVFARTDEGFVALDNSISHFDTPVQIQAQNIGDIVSTRKGAVSLAGSLSSQDDIDWYQFTVTGDFLNRLLADDDFDFADVQDAFSNPAILVFDIDFAQPDTTLAVFRQTFQPTDFVTSTPEMGAELIAYSESSNIPGDQTAIGGGVEVLRGGSITTDDPFIGPIALSPLDFGSFGLATYYVAVSSAAQRPEVLNFVDTQVDELYPNFPGRGMQVIDSPFQQLGLYGPNPEFDFNSATDGLYQLEIRVLPDLSDISAGDENRDRPQGQLLIENSSVTNSQTFGIVVEDGFRDLPLYDAFDEIIRQSDVPVLNFNERLPLRQDHGQFSNGDFIPHAGVPIALPGINEQGMYPGLTIQNNVIAGGLDGGIHLQGDPNGFVLSSHDIERIINAADGDNDGGFGAEIGEGSINRSQFTIWDHQRNFQTFQFTTDGDVDSENFIPIRIDANLPETFIDGTRDNEIYRTTATNPTRRHTLMDEIEHAIRESMLDVKTFRFRSDRGAGLTTLETVVTGMDDTEEFSYFVGDEKLFIEGAIEVGITDVVIGNNPNNATCIDPDFCFPVISAQLAQQAGVPYARIVNNTLVGRGGDLFDGNGTGDVGIAIEDNVSPTMINNIIANFGTGIRADLSSDDDTRERGTYIGGQSVLPHSFIGSDTDLDGLLDSYYTAFSDEAVDDASRLVLGGWSFAPGYALDVNGFGGDLGFQDLDDLELHPPTYAGARPSIIAANLFQGNLDSHLRMEVGESSILLQNSEPLFVDAAAGNYFLAEGTRAIDSSLDRLAERAYFREVLNSVGLESLGIVSPDTDALGLQRIDDPTVEPPGGVGNNVFKDRGALERADFTSPRALLIAPIDNDSAGLDQDDQMNAVILPGTSIPFFEILLTDGPTLSNPSFGSGIDDSSVQLAEGLITVTQNGAALVEGLDYTVAYNTTNDSISIIPAAGLWPAGAEYEIRIANGAILDRAGNVLQANQPDGSTSFSISTASGLDFGDAPAEYPTLLDKNGARHVVTSGVFLGDGVGADGDGKPSESASGDSQDDGVRVTNVFPGSIASFSVTASTTGFLNAWLDYNRNNSWADPGEQIVFSQQLTAGANAISFTVPTDAEIGQTYARFRFSTQSGVGITGEAPDGEVEDYTLNISTSSWQNTTNSLDVNNDGSVVALDINVIITELNNHVFSDAETGLLDPVPPVDNNFYDVNGDGFISPRDAVAIINHLNADDNVQAPLSGGVVFGGADRWEEDESETSPIRQQGLMDDILDDLVDDVSRAWSQS